MSGSRNILIVDDEPEIREMLAEYLASRGLDVATAEDAASMFRVLERQPIDLILLDRTMPGGDTIRQMPVLRSRFGVPIIVVTALLADGERIKGLESGADDYICKPFNPRELVARIESVLRRAEGRGGARRSPRGPMAVKRRMAAVLCADVADYVRLMNEDENATVRAWWAYRQGVIDPAVAAHGGRIVKLTGDGFFAEFDSAERAVACAVSIQEQIATRNRSVDGARRMHFRIGVNWCQIVADHEDIYGDGVNVAARLEALAEPGGIWVSQSIRDELDDDSGFALEDMGAQRVKNIDDPIPAYRALFGDAAGKTLESGQRELSAPAACA